jgi:hypothetical protein
VKLPLHDVTIRRIAANTHIDKITRADSLWRHVGLDIGHGLERGHSLRSPSVGWIMEFLPNSAFLRDRGVGCTTVPVQLYVLPKVLLLVPINFPLFWLVYARPKG